VSARTEGRRAPPRPQPSLPVRCIALDVDGTILRPNLTIHRRTVAAVAACRAQGIRVVLATGRRLATAFAYAREVGADRDLVAVDGGLVVEGEDRILRSRPMAGATAAQIVAWAEEEGVPVAVMTRRHVYGSRRRAPWHVLREARRRGTLRSVAGARHMLWELSALRPLSALDPYADPVYKVTPVGPRDRAAALRARLEAAEGLDLRFTAPGGAYEIVARGVSKGEGLAWLLRRRGVDPAHTMAVGDGWNDVEMFDRVGHPVAMANAPPGVRERARWVADHVEGEGVAAVLERVARGEWPPADELPRPAP
jgi:Cof subfamily protein (haloacid dehalogenase superfamily)